MALKNRKLFARLLHPLLWFHLLGEFSLFFLLSPSHTSLFFCTYSIVATVEAAAMMMMVMIQLARCALKITYSMMITKFSVCLKSFFFSFLFRGKAEGVTAFYMLQNRIEEKLQCIVEFFSRSFNKTIGWKQNAVRQTKAINFDVSSSLKFHAMPCPGNVHAHVFFDI